MSPAVLRALAYPFDPHPEPFLYQDGRALPLDPTDRALFAGRRPILAVGSNASPKRLLEKFAPRKFTSGVRAPVTFAVVEDHLVVHSAKFTAYGSMPATLHPWRGAQARVHATWLTDEELAVMDSTESLGLEYERIEMGALLLDCPAYSGPIETYLSLAGALSREGAPVASAAAWCSGDVPCLMDQRGAQAHAMSLLGLAGEVEDFVAENLADNALRLARTKQLSTRGSLPYHARGA